MAGYHITDIPRGEYGELSKIQEELHEIQDSIVQGCKIMELVELSDLYGAIEGYINKYHPGTSMADLATMAAITHRAFINKGRKEHAAS